MRRTMLLNIMGLSRLEEEEKKNKMENKEGMEEKRKEKAKLHPLKTPLLEQSHHRRGRFLQRNLQQGRRRALISPSWRPHS
jgi:hypothetical protein